MVLLLASDDGIVVGAARHWLVRQAGSFKLSAHVSWRSKMPMPPQPLESRVETLEDRVTMLDALPARIDSVELQIVQLRSEMHDGFSAVRAELRELKEETRQEDEKTRQQIRELKEETCQLIREGDEETRRHMLVLHEEVIGRIALLQEGLVERRPRKKRRS